MSAAGRLGLDVRCHPLFKVVPVDWTMPEGRFDGLLLGSPNVLRHGGAGLQSLSHLPVYAVGEATAAAARAHGLDVASVGSGYLQDVLDALANRRVRLLRLAGEERVSLTLPHGVEVVEVAVYRALALPMAGDLVADLAGGALVLLHSAVAARHFAAECDRLGVARRSVRLAALGPRIAAAAGEGWGEVRCAAEPAEAALLALACEMCHDPFVG